MIGIDVVNRIRDIGLRLEVLAAGPGGYYRLDDVREVGGRIMLEITRVEDAVPPKRVRRRA